MSDLSRMLDVRSLLLFEAIFAEGSVSRAAGKLGLSQPTVSIGLARLREHFGDELFVRAAGGVVATPLAEQVIWPVRDALRAIEDVSGLRSTFDPATAQRTFRIAMTDASHIALMPKIYGQVHQVAPGIRLEATGIDQTLAGRLQSGEADLAIGLVQGLETGFYQQALYAQDWICLTGDTHHLGSQPMTLDDYQAGEHVAIKGGTGQGLLDRTIASGGIRRAVKLRLPGFLGLSAILNSTGLIATLPRHIGETLAEASGLRVHECPFEIEGFMVRQHWHARFHDDPANRWIRNVCTTLFSGRGGRPPGPRD
ncbi:LysR family transcriptional regulator [Zhengella mangrovi]|uniref:LysR family transcriptional regulator n=1 Tax=Zhengella mangrovi TaxID=1982044 RepID=A0A2G1QQ86_9HYPH|nr:LysR family transcriptional regulator [Zhengella mangrovi]PHP67717.1 LysR family transcriptional regulator [Zhengella mangrovi]